MNIEHTSVQKRVRDSWKAVTGKKFKPDDVTELEENLVLVYDYRGEAEEYVIKKWYDCMNVPNHIKPFIDEAHVARVLLITNYYNDEDNQVLWLNP